MNRLQRWLVTPELIGAPDCPIIRRWTIISADKPTTSPPQGAFPLLRLPQWLSRDRKLMVHHFLPNVEDRDPHDHPRSFWTLVLWGHYYDLVPCERPHEFEYLGGLCASRKQSCSRCEDGVVLGDVMKPGTLRHRAAEHRHITQSGPKGAWTIVLMGPLSRKWGFLRGGLWYPWKSYEENFGFAMRCPTDEEREGKLLKYSDEMVPSGTAGSE